MVSVCRTIQNSLEERLNASEIADYCSYIDILTLCCMSSKNSCACAKLSELEIEKCVMHCRFAPNIVRFSYLYHIQLNCLSVEVV